MFIHPPSSRDAIRVQQPVRQTRLPMNSGPRFAGNEYDSVFNQPEYKLPNEPEAVKSYLLNGNHMTVIRGVATRTENPEVIRLLGQALLDNGKRIDESIFRGTDASLLHWAVGRGKPEFVNVLLQMGANPALRDKRGETSLDWIERMKAGTPPQHRLAIEKLLQERLIQMAQPTPQQTDTSAKPSFWTSWLFGGTAESTGAKTDAGKSLSPQSHSAKTIYADSHAQTEEEYVSPREQELSGKLSGMTQNLKNMQRQLAESDQKLTPLSEQLAEAREKNKALQRQLVPLQKGNSTLQSGNEHLRNQLQDMSEKLANAAQGKGQAEQRKAEAESRLADLKASGEKSERELRQQIQKLQADLENKQQVESKLAELEKDKASLEKTGQKNREDDHRQIKLLQAENKLLRGNLDKSEKSLKATQAAEQKARQESLGKMTQLEKLQQENADLRREFEIQIRDLKDKLSSAEMARQAAHDQSVGHQEENSRLNKQLLIRQNEVNVMMAGQEAREKHFNTQLKGLQADNHQLSTRIQVQKQEMMQRLETEERKSLALHEQLVNERENRSFLEKQHEALQREKAEMQVRFQDERHFLNERIGMAELSMENFAQQCRALEDSRNLWENAFRQRDAALFHAAGKHAMFSDVVHDLMGHVSATKQQGLEDRKLVTAVQDALFQSNDLDEIRRKVVRLILQQEERMQAVTPKDPSALLQALNIDQPLPLEFED